MSIDPLAPGPIYLRENCEPTITPLTPTPRAMMALAPKVPKGFWGDVRFIYKNGHLDAVQIHQMERA